MVPREASRTPVSPDDSMKSWSYHAKLRQMLCMTVKCHLANHIKVCSKLYSKSTMQDALPCFHHWKSLSHMSVFRCLPTSHVLAKRLR
jgi:hypothetical protein